MTTKVWTGQRPPILAVRAGNGLRRWLTALAILAIVATQIVGCAVAPEVVRENRRALEHPNAFVN